MSFSDVVGAIDEASQSAPQSAPSAPPSQSSFSSVIDAIDNGGKAPPATFAERFDAAPKPDNGNFSWSQAITDIPTEIKKEASGAVGDIKALANRGEQGPLEGLETTGKAVLAPLRLAAAPITGAARSLIGHTMANAEHAAGEAIAPNIAAQDNPQAMYETAKADTDTAMSAMGGRAAAAKAAVPSIQELKLAAARGFDSPEVKGLVLKSDALRDFSVGSQGALNADGIDDVLAPKTFGILQKMEAAPAGSTVTGYNFMSARRALQHAAASPDPTERLAASTAIDHLDNFLPNAKPYVISGDVDKASATLENARANYSAAMHSELIDRKTIQAELRAAAANSGQNVSNTIRQRMADILIKPKEQRGFTQDELNQMETIVRGTKTQNATRYGGNLLGGGGGLGAAIVGGGAGYMTGGPGAALPALGYAMKALSNRMTVAQAERLSDAIRNRAPLASSMQKFAQSAAAFNTSRTAKTVAGLNIAARNLASNLKGVGINIVPADLLKELQSPSSSSAQDQQNIPGPPGQ